MSDSTLLLVGTDVWVHAAHGYAITADFPITEAMPTLLVGDATLNELALRLKKVKRTQIPVPSKREWLVRESGGISVAHGAYGTVIRSYCGSFAWDPTTVENERLKSVAPIFISRGPSISTTRFNHSVLHGFVPQLLALRGEVVLHATCVLVDGRAFLFAGASGMGKSTLAAGFARLGLTVFSEDVVRVQVETGVPPLAHPSYPGARLRGNSFLLPSDKRTNALGRFGLPKHRVYVAASGVMQPPAALGAAFFLGNGRTVTPRYMPISQMQAMKPFLQSSFIQALPKETRSRDAFARTIKLAASIPAYELRYRRSHEHFDSLLTNIVAFVRALPRAGM